LFKLTGGILAEEIIFSPLFSLIKPRFLCVTLGFSIDMMPLKPYWGLMHYLVVVKHNMV